MKKSILIFSLFTLLSGAYGGYRSICANHLQNQILGWIEENKKQGWDIQYDRMERRGFPLAATVEIANVRIQGPSIDLKTEGTWSAGISLFGRETWLDIEGKTEIVWNQQPWQSSGHLRIQNHSPKLNESTALLKDFSLFANQWSLSRVKDSAGIEMKSGTLHFKNDGNTDRSHSFLLEAYLLGAKTHSDLDPILDPNENTFTLEAEITFPPEIFLDRKKIFPLCFQIDRWENSNQTSLGTMKGVFELDIDEKNHISGSLSLDTSVKYKENIRLSKPTSPVSSTETFKKLLSDHWEQINPLLPDLKSFGNISNEVSLHFEADQNGNEWDNWTIQLEKYALDSDLYQVGLQGDFCQSENKAHLTIEMKNHQEMIEDLARYYNRWRPLLISGGIATADQIPLMNGKIVERTLHFLESLSVPVQQKELRISLQAADGSLMVGPFNEKELTAALVEFGMDIGRELSGL